jgi:hypothetical protein
MDTQTTSTTDLTELTDHELLELAETLIKRADVKQYLPRNYRLMQLYEASGAVLRGGLALLEQCGERLKVLDEASYQELESWKDCGVAPLLGEPLDLDEATYQKLVTWKHVRF